MRSKRPLVSAGTISCIKLCLVTGMSLLLMATFPLPNASLPSDTGSGVHGSVIARLGLQDRTVIPLPDIRVFVRNITTAATSPMVSTNIDGRYQIPLQPPGEYHLCWEGDGWQAACASETLTLLSHTAYPNPIEISPEAAQGVIRGRISLADGSACRFLDPYFGVDQTAEVTVTDGEGTTRMARANSVGGYVVTGVRTADVRVVASCDGERAERTVGGREREVRAGQGREQEARAGQRKDQETSGDGAIDLVLRNHRPRIVMLLPKAGGRLVRAALPGSTVDVSAEVSDPDKDRLRYRWAPGPGSGNVTNPNAPSTRWQLPTARGRHTLYLLVDDGRGGVQIGSVTLTVSPEGRRPASGRVIDGATGAGVPGATVSLNGTTATTDPTGAFSLTVSDSDRFVLNITRPGYALQSRTSRDLMTGVVWRLMPAQSMVADPKSPITVLDQRPALRRAERRGARVEIPANALVDPRTKAPVTGPVTVSVATLDVSRDPVPGDWGGLDRKGQAVRLVSYGVVDVDIRDAAGQPLQLAPGQRAKVTLPVEPGQLRNDRPPPATAPLWYYDEGEGLWREEGVATLSGSDYVMEVTHFSTINVDVALTVAACMRVVLGNGIPIGTVLRVTVPTGSTSTQAFDVVLNDPVNAIYRLPPNSDIVLEPLTTTGQPDPLTRQTVNAGPAVADHFPPAPYSDCREANLSRIPAWGNYPNSLFLTFKGSGTLAETERYYALVDPTDLRLTLGQWWAANGFNADGTGGTRASYMNHNDLGFGRDMNCRQSGGDVSCYVSNYGGPDQNLANADLAQNQDRAQAGATVAMEYSAVQGNAGRIVKFFVYQGGESAGVRLSSADLDGFGQKFAPQLCMVCHGGVFPAGLDSAVLADLKANSASRAPFIAAIQAQPSSFREFDLSSFRFPGARDRTQVTPFEEGRFKALNDMVAASSPWVAVSELIQGWYAGGGPVIQNSNFTPANWQGTPQQGNLYRQVVAASCRTCHIAQESNPSNAIDFREYSSFGIRRSIIDYYVCGSNKAMPHALLTFRNFWLSSSPRQPDVLRNFSSPAVGPVPAWVAFSTCP